MNHFMEDLEDEIRKEVHAWASENPEEDLDEGWMSNLIDQSVPIDYSDLFDAADSDFSILTTKPKYGPAFDRSPTALNIIAAVIYDRLSKAAHDEWRDIEIKRAEEADAAAARLKRTPQA